MASPCGNVPAMSFDETVDRSALPASRWNPAALKEHFKTTDVLPLWIAEMDFRAPPPVVDRLVERARLGMYGYEYRPESLFDVITAWFGERHGWPIERSYLRFCPSVMNAICALMNLYTEPGDAILVQPPVFFEFRQAIGRNERELVKNALRFAGGRYQMDFEDLEAKASQPQTKMLILCNPHNPVGRVWTRDELRRVAEICAHHDVFVVSDEIYADIIYGDNRYTPFVQVAQTAGASAASCLSPAKTFNLAGMMDAVVVLPEEDQRKRFRELASRFFWNRTNVFTTLAAETAYREGGAWLDELLLYLSGNIAFIDDFLARETPGVELVQPEGTYLAWLDFRGLGLDVEALGELLSQRARVALNSGHWFGREGAGFARMSFACPRSVLEDALTRIAGAIAG